VIATAIQTLAKGFGRPRLFWLKNPPVLIPPSGIVTGRGQEAPVSWTAQCVQHRRRLRVEAKIETSPRCAWISAVGPGSGCGMIDA